MAVATLQLRVSDTNRCERGIYPCAHSPPKMLSPTGEHVVVASPTCKTAARIVAERHGRTHQPELVESGQDRRRHLRWHRQVALSGPPSVATASPVCVDHSRLTCRVAWRRVA